MKVAVIPTADAVTKESVVNKSVVMFDILRASSTISTALANGCKEVIPVVEVEDAFAVAKTLPENTFIIGGERGALKVPGFHLGNSPLEYTADVVSGKTVILTTTNGTKATSRAAAGASQVFIGSLLNISALARRIMELGKDVVLVCAGTRGKFSLDDTLAAGMMVRELVQLWRNRPDAPASTIQVAEQNKPGVVYLDEVPVISGHTLVLEDAAVAALRLAEAYLDNPLRGLYDCLHGQKLAQLGFAADLAYCAQVDILDVVPVYQDGKIIIER